MNFMDSTDGKISAVNEDDWAKMVGLVRELSEETGQVEVNLGVKWFLKYRFYFKKYSNNRNKIHVFLFNRFMRCNLIKGKELK